ncbi:tripartite tricarboxylate transporter substrate binding protein [Bordetella sp. BOR01]|uniref:Bug family tripartite tricarboxylate transporter substrate binding protein n=1 Tax=Bordetella sp. BOR01 TaxID=2854779 RepID=UPI001C440910|nr:tripartite tricarboxylate transporter substrate binding protein [Bordetella sp. BOR01]MBV7483324.1 tripartite tricarboxylate transporter substrate binding protein [Bordetella sp. BOR01]
MKRLKLIGTCLLVCGAISTHAYAWEPVKPIQLIVGFSAGGGTDVIARAIAAGAKDVMPQPIVVVNRPGASGVIAADQVARAEPDGYTLLVAGGSESTSLPNHQKVPYDLAKDFRPVAHVIRLRTMMAVKGDSSIKTFADLVAYAKANPGKLSYGTSGVGSLTHSMMLMVNKAVGIDTFHVPYKGDADVMTALLGDQIQIALGSPDQLKPWIDSGKMTPLTLSSNDRYPGLPNVPTLKELGYDIYLENMKGIVAPAGLPDDIYAYLNEHLRQAMQTQAFKTAVQRSNFEVQYMNGPTFGEAMRKMSNGIAAALSSSATDKPLAAVTK